MNDRLERDVRFLKRYALASTLASVVLVTAAFTREGAPRREKFTEIDVERINVLEPNGNYRLVISNRARSIGPIYKGKPFGYPGGNRPGLIWFNDEGTENGGMTFTGRQLPNGQYVASTHMSFDQFNQDQVLNFDYADQNGKRRVGMSIADRPDLDIHDLVVERDSIMRIADTVARAGALKRWASPRNGVPMVAQRLFIGRDPDKNAVLNLADREGKPRLRLAVDSLGNAKLEFLDAAGKVTYRLPNGP